MSKKRALSLLILLALVAILLAGCAPVRDAEGNVSAPTWIAWLAAPLAAVIQALYEKVLTPLGLASYGLAIILVTILIRLLLYPLTRKQMESMKKMQAVQPKMKELQEKYGKDRNKLAEKQMELYREEGVNPAGGCLPLLIQMPILFAFYYALLTFAADPDADPDRLLLRPADVGPQVGSALPVDPQSGFSSLLRRHVLADAGDAPTPVVA